ncbi:MAG: PorV/PorQ family protein [Candidatus Delongbacteria bacterium]|nr:PorV/PorQ family protein [Candidatus Delongbacteria bacterium]MBN2835019.1 PorV/PorQ family protein [Candidatus Delongbacteria bacterium]
MKMILKIALLMLFGANMLYSDILLLTELETDPVSASMRNTMTAKSPSIHSMQQNPASMSLLKDRVFALTYTKGFDDSYNTSVKINYGLDSLSSIYGLLIHESFGEFEKIDGATYSASESVIGIGYSRNMYKDIQSGLTVKYLFSDIEDYSGSAIVADLNFYKKLFEDKIGISAGFYNFGFQMEKFGDDTEDLPTTFKIGISNQLDKAPIEIIAQYTRFLNQEVNEYTLGAEFIPNDMLSIRAGYNFCYDDFEIGTGDKKELFSGVAAGLGINYDKFDFDFAYKVDGYLDDQFWLGVVYSLDTGESWIPNFDKDTDDGDNSGNSKRRKRR